MEKAEAEQIPQDYGLTPDASGWSASLYNQVASFVYSTSVTTPVLELLSARPGERIIDFGCGSGEVTLELEKIVTSGEGGIVVGVDASQSMIDKAKSAGLKHAFLADIQSLDDLPEPFSISSHKFHAVFSNAAFHWCKRDPIGVLHSAKRVLKPGGRLVGEMGGFMNCVGVRSALYQVLRRRGYDPVAMDPWYFPSVSEYESLLQSAGFKPLHVSLNPRYTPLPAGLAAWLHLFARNSFLRDLSDETADAVIKEVIDICEVDCKDGQGQWALMYMRLRFHAILP